MIIVAVVFAVGVLLCLGGVASGNMASAGCGGLLAMFFGFVFLLMLLGALVEHWVDPGPDCPYTYATEYC